jgi:CheY-like chemotaxis protein
VSENKRILVIEDNEQNLYLVKFLLESAGYEVFSAMDSTEGVMMAETISPDMILLDIQLPTLDGYAVARMIREKEPMQAIPIVAVTSYAMPGDREKALASGCNGYVEKPIDPDTFLETMEQFFPKQKTD